MGTSGRLHTAINARVGQSARMATIGEADKVMSDLAFAEHLTAVLDTALADHPPHLTLDVSDVWLIDASVIRVLIDFHERAAAINCGFRIAGANGLVRRVLEITGVLPMLTDEL